MSYDARRKEELIAVLAVEEEGSSYPMPLIHYIL